MNQSAHNFPPQPQEQDFSMQDAATFAALEMGMGPEAFDHMGPAAHDPIAEAQTAQVQQEQEQVNFAGFDPFLMRLFIQATPGSEFQQNISKLMIGESVLRSAIGTQQHERQVELQHHQSILDRQKNNDKELVDA